MPTPHIAAAKGEIAATVLMPGDPLRAKFIAESFLQNIRLVNDTRGMLGYTGLYKGQPVSVMGSGMGMPSIGIYSWELYTQYDVEAIIRIGSAGAYAKELALYDVVLATGAWSESSYAKTQSGFAGDTTQPSEALNQKLRQSAAAQSVALTEGIVHSSDVFYRQPQPEGGTPYWQALHTEKGCLAVEMESFALFHNAAVCNKQAACLLTISDSFTSNGVTTAEEREKSFTAMMHVALGCVAL